MPLTPGARLGPYEVLSKLGEGGMGEVYRARDTKLNRDVAIKVLPDLFAEDVERLARFTREAQTLASLNHPNIAAIYGIEERAIVMELVDGQDLSELIGDSRHSAPAAAGPSESPSRGTAAGGGGAPRAISIEDTLAIARQIIDALEAAHDLGIVHRDLKPQNIKVRDDGTVKVLDFGLAKAMDHGTSGPQDSNNSPTLTARATQMGMIIGTAAYMSPEQARGRAVDKRTDVWAFGCVLYEMLTGTRAFDGEDATEIISSVVKSEPNWNALPATVPAHVRTIVTRCLVKDRKARIPDLSVVRYMLDGTMPSGEVAAAAPVAAPPASSRVWQFATAALLLTTIVAGAAWYRGRAVEPASTRFTILPPPGTVFTASGITGATMPVISPDGRSVAFTAQDAAGKRLLYVRHLDSIEALPMAGTEGAGYPFWSPDSRSIGFAVLGKLVKVDASGGPVQTLCTLNPGILSRGGTWSREGVIVFNNGPTVLYRVPAAGGTAVAMGKLDGQAGREFPSFLPDGRHFLFHASGSADTAGVYVGSIDSGDVTRVFSADSGAVYDSVTRQILFVRGGTLLAQAFDPGTLAVSGEPVPVADRVESAVVPGAVAFSISETGVLAYGIGASAASGSRMTWMNRKGEILGTVGPAAPYRGLDLSPDEQQVAAHRHDGEGGDVWLTETSRNATSRFTLDAAQENSAPVWSPTGDRIAYQSMRDGKPGINVRSSNGLGAEERVYETTSSRLALPLSWTPDGKSLLFGVQEPATNRDLWMLTVEGEHKPVPRLQTTAAEAAGQISPDGRWLAYQSDETGAAEVYVLSLSGTPGKWPISTSGGNAPRWRGDSKELFYVGAGKVWAVEIGSKGDALLPGEQKALFDYRGIANAAHTTYFISYDVSKDGQKLLVTRRESEGTGEPGASPAVVVLNWWNNPRP